MAILIETSDIDLRDEFIAKKYAAIIASNDWSEGEKKRVIAAKETGRLRNIEASKKVKVEGNAQLTLLKTRVEELEKQVKSIHKILKEIAS